MRLSDVPARTATGAYILHSGLEKWRADEEAAQGMHGFATGAYPFLSRLGHRQFLKLLGAGEIALGGALLAPFVPRRLAGAGLTAFSAGLVGLYSRTPGMRKPGSIWPTQQGIALSKDAWLLGLGLTLLLED